MEKFNQIENNMYAARKMKYAELVDSMNEDIKSLEQIESPLTLYKDEKAMVAE